MAQRPDARAELAGRFRGQLRPGAGAPHRCFLAFDRALLHAQGREAGLERQAARVLYRGEARQTLPPIGEWRRFDAADVQPGLFLREARRQLMVGESPKVARRSTAGSG